MRYLYACTTISPIFMENKNTDKSFKNSVFDIAPSLGVLSLVLSKKRKYYCAGNTKISRK